MPTKDEIHEYRQWRGKFINAVWDAEAVNDPEWPAVDVRAILRNIGANDLPAPAVARLVNDLVGDGLLEAMMETNEEPYPVWVKLTSWGRLEVERWISEDEPTEHLALAPSQIFTTHFHGNVDGSNVVIGSPSTTVNQQTAIGESLTPLIEKARELLTQWDEGFDDREAVEADVEILEEERNSSQPKPARLKAALKRVGAWAAGIAGAGARPELVEEVQRLTHQALQQL
jgi:hypothetical protein